MPKRKSNKVRSDGRFRVKYKGKQFYGATNAEAVRKMEEYKRMEERGMNAREAENTTVSEYALKWLPIHKASVSDQTYNGYAKQIDVLIDYIGKKRIMDVVPSDIKEIYSKHYLGMSDTVVRTAAALYRGIFASAKEDGLCMVNPCESKAAKPHKGTEGTHRAITEEERELIETVPHRFQLAAMIMLYAGLRRGEMLALDLNNDIMKDGQWMIRVRQSIRYVKHKPTTVGTKTKSGYRDVPVFDTLKTFLESSCCDGHPVTMCHSDEIATLKAFEYGWESYNKELSKSAGHEIRIRTHDLRHTYCTMLRDAGVDMHMAMTWMGHADEKMILKVYDHITEKRVANAVKEVEKYMDRVQNGVQNDNNT